MTQVVEGVHELLTPFPEFTFEESQRLRKELEKAPRVTKGLPYVLPYMIASGGDVVLIDCGWNTDGAYDALAAGMKDHGAAPEEISRLLITHVHPDHYGMAGRLKRLSNCEVVIHEADAEVIRDRYLAPKGLTEGMARFMEMNGVPPLDAPNMSRGSMGMLDKVAPVPPDREVKGGESIKVGDFDLQVVWTPGHSPGHICFYEPNRKILFSGDHILPTITPNVSMHTQSHGSPLGDYIRSLEVVAALDVEHCYPAHEFGIGDLKKRVREIYVHHEERLDEMLRCVDRGGFTAWEVAGRVKWATGMLSDFEPFMQRAAVGETMSHLEFLWEQGKLARVMREGHQYWTPV